MPTMTTQDDGQTATELTRQRLIEARIAETQAKEELINFGATVARLVEEEKSVRAAIEEAGAQRSAAIASGDESKITQSRKKLVSLKSREEEIAESLPLIRGQYSRREREVTNKSKDTRQLEKNLWIRISDELREQTPPEVISFFERLYAAALLGGGGTVQFSSLLAGAFPGGIRPEQVKKRQDELREEFGF